MLEFQVDNIFVVFAGKVFQQTVSIQMGTNCAHLLADIFLNSLEADFIQPLLSTGKKHLASRFNLTYRYIDDVLSIKTQNLKIIWTRCILLNLRSRRLFRKLLKQGYLVERLKSSFRKFYGRYGDLIQQYEVSLSQMLMIFWPLTKSDFPTDQTLYKFHYLDTELDLHRIMSGFHGTFDMPTGNAYPSGYLVPSPFLGLDCAQIVETRFLELAVSLLVFSHWLPLGTFSILPPTCFYRLNWNFAYDFV